MKHWLVQRRVLLSALDFFMTGEIKKMEIKEESIISASGEKPKAASSTAKSLIDRIMWLLTIILFSSFYITSLSEYGNYILLLITGVAFIVISIANGGKIQLKISRLHISMLLFSAFSFISTIWALNSSDAIEKGITIFEILICMSVFYMYYGRNENVETLINAIMIAGFIISVYNFFYVGLGNILRVITNSRVLTDTFDNRNNIAIVSAISIILSLHYIIYRRKRLWVFFDLFALLNVAAVGSKKGFLILIVGFFAFFLVKAINEKKTGTFLRIIAVIAVTYLLVLLMIRARLFSGIMGRFDTMISTLIGDSNVNYSTYIRAQYINMGWDLFLHRPILGYGMGNAHLYAYSAYGTDTYLHNNYIELLVNGGIVGTIIYYSMHISVLRRTLRRNMAENEFQSVCISLLAILLFVDVASVTYYSKETYFYLMILFIYVESIKKFKYND